MLKQAFRALILLAHPDKGGSEEDMKVLSEVRDFFRGFVDKRCRQDQAEEGQCVQGEASQKAEPVLPIAKARAKKAKTQTTTPGIMFTYNGDFLGGERSSEDVVEAFRAFVAAAKKAIEFRRFPATLELSIRSNRTITLAEVFGEDSLPECGVTRVHLHLFVDWTDARELDIDALRERMQFEGTNPHMHVCRARGRGKERSLDRSHFYVRAEKVGSLHFFGNVFPWTEWAAGGVGNYRVEGRWIDDLWSEHKLSNAVYLRYAELVRVDFTKRRVWHDAVASQIRSRKLDAEVQSRERALVAQYAEWVPVPAIDAWRYSLRDLKSRYDILVLRAGSKSGKTERAKSLFPFVWEQVIEDLPAPNLRSHNPDKDDAILLDNVNSADFILSNRGLLMARNVVHELAQTSTGLFTYPCYLHRVPIIVTMDVEKEWPDSDWLNKNCVVVELAQG